MFKKLTLRFLLGSFLVFSAVPATAMHSPTADAGLVLEEFFVAPLLLGLFGIVSDTVVLPGSMPVLGAIAGFVGVNIGIESASAAYSSYAANEATTEQAHDRFRTAEYLSISSAVLLAASAGSGFLALKGPFLASLFALGALGTSAGAVAKNVQARNEMKDAGETEKNKDVAFGLSIAGLAMNFFSWIAHPAYLVYRLEKA